jgi:hypothetical protein
MEMYLSMFAEFLGTASEATIEAGNSIVTLVIPDLGSATGAASTQPNHQGCPWGVHRSTVVPLAVDSSAINRRGSSNSSTFQKPSLAHSIS